MKLGLFITVLLIFTSASAQIQSADSSAEPTQVQEPVATTQDPQQAKGVPPEKNDEINEQRPAPTLGPIANAQEGFQKGVQAFQNKNFELAELAFSKAVQKEPNNKYLLFNYGLSAMEQKKWGLAIGAWRRALFVDPGFDSAQRWLEKAYEKLPNSKPEVPGPLKAFANNLVLPLSIHLLLALLCCLGLATGWIVIRYLGQRRQAYDSDGPLPHFPMGAVFSGTGLVLFIFLSSYKMVSLFTNKATVIVNTQKVHSGPAKENTDLFEISEGQEVFYDRSDNGWAQVTYPNGLTGWVPNKSIFIHSGRFQLW